METNEELNQMWSTKTDFVWATILALFILVPNVADDVQTVIILQVRADIWHSNLSQFVGVKDPRRDLSVKRNKIAGKGEVHTRAF